MVKVDESVAVVFEQATTSAYRLETHLILHTRTTLPCCSVHMGSRQEREREEGYVMKMELTRRPMLSVRETSDPGRDCTYNLGSVQG